MKEKTTILYIVEAMAGGILSYLEDLSNALADTCDIHIAYGMRKETPEDFRKNFDTRVHFIRVAHFCRAIRPAEDLAAFRELRRIADEVRPDIIHLHSSKAGALGRIAFAAWGRPVFYTPHGYSFLMQDAGRAKRFLYRAIEALCGKCPATTVSCSEGEHRESLALARRAVYINNGINTAALDALLAALPAPEPHPFTVFTLGRISAQKDPALFNETALAAPDVRFLWIGDGDLRGALTAPNIEVTGWVRREEALAHAAGADMFILTSLWEGLPISLLEAMYMKKPCAVTDVIGNRDVIRNGENGFICSTAEQFAAAIRRAERGECKDVIRRAHEEILTEYNTKVMTECYRTLYRDAIGRDEGTIQS